ncbi:MAG TPA: CLC_0170 family protein [Patescibacteria group bacterium]|nr:CLC_0170 family protein [Patescibacteria group bacterium]
MINTIVQNIQNFYDTTVFFVILAIGVFLLLWDYPIFKLMKYKIDTRVTLVIGIMFLILPFVLYAVSRM